MASTPKASGTASKSWTISLDGSKPMRALDADSTEEEIKTMAFAFSAGPYQDEEYPHMYAKMKRQVQYQKAKRKKDAARSAAAALNPK